VSKRPNARDAVGLAKAFARGGERREAAVASLLSPTNLFQPYTTTAADRYPDEFALIAAESDPAPARILSFGCSSGPELLSLHQTFPSARIHGIDINPLAVRTARKAVRDAGLDGSVTVARGSDADAEQAASYDVATALAVFRHGSLKERPASCASLIRFADFDRTVAGIAAALRPGGLFLIRHANFRFTDTAAAAGFELVRLFIDEGAAEASPTYGTDDALLGAAHDDGLYRKVR
jgi:SAM-dependent methyltransferase